VELGILFDHRDDAAPHLLGQHGHLDVLVIFEAIANDGGVIVGQGHDGHQLGFRTGLQTEMEGLAELQDLFDHLPLLVYLDGVDAGIAALVFVFPDGRLKCGVQFAEAMLEADQDGKINAAQHESVDQFFQVDRAPGFLFRMDADVAVVAHGKVPFAPTGDVIEVAGGLGRPSFGGLNDERAFAAVCCQFA